MITVNQLSASLKCPIGRAQKFIDSINDAMVKYEINTSLRIAHFIAQIGHESGRLVYVHEIASGDAYNNRADLGNTKHEAIATAKLNGKTAGEFYRGHGLIQITGYDNHLACGVALGIDLVNKPSLLEMPQYAALSAAWFWNTHHLNVLADNDLLIQITKRVNGGTNGLDDRRLILIDAKIAMGIV